MQSCTQNDINQLTMVAPSGGVTKDVPVVIGSLCLIPVASAVEDELFAGKVLGQFELPKTTGAGKDFAAGELVEWDASAAKCIPNGGAQDDFDLGYAVEAAGEDDTTVKVAKVLATTTVNV